MSFDNDDPDNTYGFEPEVVKGEDGVRVEGSGQVIVSFASAFFLKQTEWHINAVTGSDKASGKTAAKAIKTWAELRRRLGRGPITHTTTVFIDSDLPATDPMIIDFELDVSFGNGEFLAIVGTQTLLRAGTFTAVTPYNPATNTAGSVTDAALPAANSWTALGLVGKLFVLPDRPVTFPLIGFPSGFVALDLGARTMRFSPIGDGGAIPITSLPPVLNERYQVVQLTQINGYMRSQTTGASGLLLLNMEFAGELDEPAGSVSAIIESGWFFPINCIFSGPPGVNVQIWPGVVEINPALCRFAHILSAFGGTTFLECDLFEDVVESAAPSSRITADDLNLFQGVVPTAAGSRALRARRQGLFTVSAPQAVFNAEVGAVVRAGSQMDLEAGLFGQGVTVDGIEIDSYGVCFFDPAAASTMIAPANQVLVGATPTTYLLPLIEATTNAGYVPKYGY